MDTTDITLPDARASFHNFYWLSLKSSPGSNSELHHSRTARTAPTHYLTNLTDKLKTHMHKNIGLALLTLQATFTTAGRG
eukprot:225619-Pelagomonas_calceolata.AAC.1